MSLQIGQGRVVLLGQSRGEKPGDHHVDVVFIRADCGHPLQILRVESCRLQIVTHQHAHAEAAGIDVRAGHPAANGRKQRVGVPGEHPGRQHIAGGPIIYIRKKDFHRGQAGVIIAHQAQQRPVQIVFIIGCMGQHGQKGGGLRRARGFLGQRAQLRGAHTPYLLRRHGGHQLALKQAVGWVGQRMQPGRQII